MLWISGLFPISTTWDLDLMDRTSMVDQTFQYYECHVLILIINKNSRQIFWTVMDRYLKLHETFSKNRRCTPHNFSIDGNTRREVSWTESCRRGPADAHIPAGSVERGEGGSCSERGWTRVRLQRVQKKEKRLASGGSGRAESAWHVIHCVEMVITMMRQWETSHWNYCTTAPRLSTVNC